MRNQPASGPLAIGAPACAAALVMGTGATGAIALRGACVIGIPLMAAERTREDRSLQRRSRQGCRGAADARRLRRCEFPGIRHRTDVNRSTPRGGLRRLTKTSRFQALDLDEPQPPRPTAP